jgi:predicted anti-sigma-YlaC factor YlaD
MLTPVPPTDCMRARESASARLDGELVELQAAHLDAHLRLCPECLAYVDGIAASTGLLRAAALDQPSAAMFTPMPTRRRRIGLLPAVAAAAIMIAIAGSSFAVGGVLGRQGSTTTAPTTTQAASARGGPVDALVLPAILSPQSQPFHVTRRIIAL